MFQKCNVPAIWLLLKGWELKLFQNITSVLSEHSQRLSTTANHISSSLQSRLSQTSLTLRPKQHFKNLLSLQCITAAKSNFPCPSAQWSTPWSTWDLQATPGSTTELQGDSLDSQRLTYKNAEGSEAFNSHTHGEILAQNWRIDQKANTSLEAMPPKLLWPTYDPHMLLSGRVLLYFWSLVEALLPDF